VRLVPQAQDPAPFLPLNIANQYNAEMMICGGSIPMFRTDPGQHCYQQTISELLAQVVRTMGRWNDLQPPPREGCETDPGRGSGLILGGALDGRRSSDYMTVFLSDDPLHHRANRQFHTTTPWYGDRLASSYIPGVPLHCHSCPGQYCSLREQPQHLFQIIILYPTEF